MSLFSSSAWVRLFPFSIRQRFAGREHLFSMLHNSGWLLLDKLVRLLLGLLVGAWVARYLGPSQYGELSYVIAYLAFFQAIASLGLDGIVVRDLARNNQCADCVLGSSFVLRLSLGLVCWVFAVVSMAVINGWHDRSVKIAALAGGVLIFQAADTVDLWFQSQGKSRLTAIVKMAAYVGTSFLKVLMVLWNAPLIVFALMVTVEVAVASVGMAFLYRKFPFERRWRFLRSQSLKLIKECWPFMISGLAIIVYMRIDQIMIKGLLGAEALGIYSAVLPLATAPNFLPMILSTVLMPVLSRLYSENKEAYRRMLVLTFRAGFYAALIMSVIVALLSDFVVRLLFGEAYYFSSGVLSIYIFSSCFTWLGVLHSLWLVNENKGLVRLYGTLTGAVVCVLANVFLIPIWGLKGAAIVAILSQFVSAVAINLIFAKESFDLQVEGVLFIKSTWVVK